MKLKGKKIIYLTFILIITLVIGVGYTTLSNKALVTKNTVMKNNKWDIHFKNIKMNSNSVDKTTPIITNGTNINYAVLLEKPGDYYEFSVDVVNKGSIDAVIESISKKELTSKQKKYLDYTVLYSDGKIIKENQKLKSGEKETIKVRVEYKKDITKEDLPTEDETINLSLNINYIQAY